MILFDKKSIQDKNVRMLHAICIAVLLCLIAPLPSIAEMLGPYSGMVLDETTGKPIEGASVLFYWRKRIVHFEGSTDLIDAKLTYTKASGKYNLSAVFANTGLPGGLGLDSTHVIIYQPGYQVYILDNPYAKPDPDFRNSGNVVTLERIPPDFDHKAHYERIEHSVDLLERRDDYSEKKDVSWEGILKSGLRMPLEREQFLRRVEWEQRRSGREGKQ